MGEERMTKEPRHTDRIDWICFGISVFWVAVAVVAGLIGYADLYGWPRVWSIAFMGAGWVTLFGTAVRILLPNYRRNWSEWLVLALLFLGIGHGDTMGWVWPVVTTATAVLLAARLVRNRPPGSDAPPADSEGRIRP